MHKIFLSYRRNNLDEVLLLANQLKARGLSTWQDVSDLSLGRPTEQQIRDALALECDGFLVYLTKDSLESDYVMKVELLAALRQRDDDPEFAIIPVFRGISIADAKDATVAVVGRDITTFSGVKISDPKRISTEKARSRLRSELATVAGRALQAALKRNTYSFTADQDRRLILDIHTRQYTRQTQVPDLDLDWRGFFNEGGSLPSPLVWADTLLPALTDIKQGVATEYGTGTVYVRAKAHLSVGVALGFAFRATTGFHLNVVQGQDLWATDCTPQDREPLVVSTTGGGIDSRDLAVELSITGDVAPKVDSFVRKRGQTFRARVKFQPPAGAGRDAVAGTEEALAMAIQVCMEIRRVRGEYGTDKTHVFAMMPLALAMLLGHQLNACGPVQMYEYDNETSSYQPSCLLTCTVALLGAARRGDVPGQCPWRNVTGIPVRLRFPCLHGGGEVAWSSSRNWCWQHCCMTSTRCPPRWQRL